MINGILDPTVKADQFPCAETQSRAQAEPRPGIICSLSSSQHDSRGPNDSVFDFLSLAALSTHSAYIYLFTPKLVYVSSMTPKPAGIEKQSSRPESYQDNSFHNQQIFVDKPKCQAEVRCTLI